jgi:argininosuccinate lyase
LALGKGVALERLSLSELKGLSALFEADALAVLDPLAVVRARSTRGGTAPDAVRAQLVLAKEALKKGRLS